MTPPGGVPVMLSEPYLRQKAGGGPVDILPRGTGESEWTIPEGEYFVMGDNRPESEDSRVFGAISRDLIVGRAWVRYFPLGRIGFMSRPSYPELDDRQASLRRGLGLAWHRDEAVAPGLTE